MNYLLRDVPVLRLVETSGQNILLGLGIIILGISILHVIINAIFKKRKKEREGNKNEETD